MKTERETMRPTVVFAGGGTAGHLFPGLAVAKRLAADMTDVRILFVGGGREQERRLVSESGFDYLAIDCQAAPRRLRDISSFLKANWSGYRTARKFLIENHTRIVVGLGGYASVPMARAALRHKIPLVLLEQNAVPGRANRYLARRAALVCSAFAEVGHHLPRGCHWRMTGNPVRESFLVCRVDGASPGDAGRTFHGPHRQAALRGPWPPVPSEEESAEQEVKPPPIQPPKQLLVLGGSRGARWLNTNVPLALAELESQRAGWRIVHQTGSDDYELTAAAYESLGIEASVYPFILDVARELTKSDVAVCRAGGTTLAELAVSGVPAVLVPYPFAADDHQRENAEVFVRAGAALLLDQSDAGEYPERSLAELIARMTTGRATREIMSRRTRALAHPDAAWDISTILRTMIHEQRHASSAGQSKRQSAA